MAGYRECLSFNWGYVMSTRAVFIFKDLEFGTTNIVYKHSDGYPEGACEAINNTLSFAWELPRYEGDEFAAAFVAANKSGQGGVRLVQSPKHIAADVEYIYTVWQPKGATGIFVRARDADPPKKILYEGPFIAWREVMRAKEVLEQGKVQP